MKIEICKICGNVKEIAFNTEDKHIVKALENVMCNCKK